MLRIVALLLLSTCSICTKKKPCFFQLPGQNVFSGIDVKLIFKNNSAGVAGSVLYGGVIDHCKLTHGLDLHSSGEVFDMLVHNNDSGLLEVMVIAIQF